MSWQPRVIQGGKAPPRPTLQSLAEFRNQLNNLVFTFRNEHRGVEDVDLVHALAELTIQGAISTDRFSAEVFGTMMRNLYEHFASGATNGEPR